MKTIFLIILILPLVIIAIVIIKTLTYPFAIPHEPYNQNSEPEIDIKITDKAIYRFSQGIKIPTVSDGDRLAFNFEPFDRFKSYLRSEFPIVYSHAGHYEVNEYGLVFRWKGKNSDLKPILFLSHMDVVPPGDAPVKNTTTNDVFNPENTPLPAVMEVAKEWEYGPFSGAVANGRIYGRGTLDMKGMLFAIMESTTQLMENGFTPERDIYLAFGFDEEVGGAEGAAKIAEDFKNKGIEFETVYDEGGVVLENGSAPGINSEVALIGTAEKGFLTVKIKVNGMGGHSSMPPIESAIGKAAIIMRRLEDKQMKPFINPLIGDFFKNVGGSMSFASRMAIANQWLLSSVLLGKLTKNNSTNSLVRTTTALTMMKGSDAANVLSPQVEFVVNFRTLPGNTIEEVREHIKKACEGFDVELEEIHNPKDASKVSPTNHRGYAIMEETIKKLFPKAIITPYLTIARTDAVKYEIVSDHVYRFMPVKINRAEQGSIHNTNEYISIENFGRMIAYFKSVMQNYDAGS